jgi:hypothetical protein
MMSHLEEGVLQGLIDGEIPSSQLGPIQAHLTSCAECRARLDEARTIGAEADRLIETIELPEAPARVAPRRPAAPRRTWVRNVAWAATMVIAAGVGYLARNTDVAPPAQESAAKSPVVLPASPPAPAANAAAPAPRPVAPEASQPQRRPQGLADKAARERAKDLEASPAAGAPSERRFDELKPTVAGKLSPLAALDSDSVRKKAGARRLGDSPVRLEEMATTATSDSRAAASPPAPSLHKQTESKALAQALVAPVEITLDEALKRLDGALRLIEGMVPLRIEALGAEIRVVYPLGSGLLLLTEHLENGKLVYRLVAPTGFPADSLERLRARVRE